RAEGRDAEEPRDDLRVFEQPVEVDAEQGARDEAQPGRKGLGDRPGRDGLAVADLVARHGEAGERLPRRVEVAEAALAAPRELRRAELGPEPQEAQARRRPLPTPAVGALLAEH